MVRSKDDDKPEIELAHDDKDEDKPADKWYFVDDSIKERLGGGDGPSFSVASLFSSKCDTFIEQDETPSTQEESTAPSTLAAPVSIWKKDSLFIVERDDTRISGAARFFDVQPSEVSAKELMKRRREISLIVQSKFKRVERNREKFQTGPSKFSNPRRNFKKQKT